MFEKKDYYISELSKKNIYQIIQKNDSSSVYEKWFTVKDEKSTEYILLMDRIGNRLPEITKFYFQHSFHPSVIYPLDLIISKSEYWSENEIGFVLPKWIKEYTSLETLLHHKEQSYSVRKQKINAISILFQTIRNLHESHIYLNGIDPRQIFMKDNDLKIRYNGFNIDDRNSIYRIPDFIAAECSMPAWELDAFSIMVILFECIYEWHPFFGALTSFSKDEEYIFEVFYQNFRKKIFIFNPENSTNPIGFLTSQNSIIKKWRNTEDQICDIFQKTMNLNFPVDMSEQKMDEWIQKVLLYYQNQDIVEVKDPYGLE